MYWGVIKRIAFIIWDFKFEMEQLLEKWSWWSLHRVEFLQILMELLEREKYREETLGGS